MHRLATTNAQVFKVLATSLNSKTSILNTLDNQSSYFVRDLCTSPVDCENMLQSLRANDAAQFLVSDKGKRKNKRKKIGLLLYTRTNPPTPRSLS